MLLTAGKQIENADIGREQADGAENNVEGHHLNFTIVFFTK
jgi:hypothetical protein